MKRFHFATIFLFAAMLFPALAQAQTVNFTASNIRVGGVKLASGQLCALPVDNSNHPLPAAALGGSAPGALLASAACTTVTTGALPGGFLLPDTALTNPLHVCLRITVTDANQNGKAIYQTTCAQPASSGASTWCSTSGGLTTCNFDNYWPSLPAQALVQPGPPGPAGTANWRGAWAAATAYARNDGFVQSLNGYIVTAAYTSGGSFGSTDTANSILVQTGCALTGCTLSGPLNGTTGNFSGTLAVNVALPSGSANGASAGGYLYQPGGTINVRQFGAVCDGSPHPLSGYYSTLAAAQAVYPFVTSLTQELDYAGVQKTLNSLTPGPWTSGDAYVPGVCLTNTTIVMQNGSIGLGGSGWGTSLSAIGSALKWSGTSAPVVGGVHVASPGAYSVCPTGATFTGGGGSGATATVICTLAGGVSSVRVTNRGSGYTGIPTVGFTGGTGTAATATALMSAGVPLLQTVDAWGSRIVHLRLIGSTTARPTAALNINEQDGAMPNDNNLIDGVYIGAIGSVDSDSGIDFVDGILLDGVDSNNSLNVARNSIISNVVNGVNASNDQASLTYLDNVQINGSNDCGIRSASLVNGGSIYLANNAVDLCTVQSSNAASGYGLFTFQNLLSELGGRLLTIEGNEGGLVVSGSGSFSITTSTAPDGKVIYSSGQAGREVVDLSNFSFPQEGSSTPPAIDMESGSGGTYSIHLLNSGVAFSDITCTVGVSPVAGCKVGVEGPLETHSYQGNANSSGAGAFPDYHGPASWVLQHHDYQNAINGAAAQGGTACLPLANSRDGSSLIGAIPGIWQWCALHPNNRPDDGTAGDLVLQYQHNGLGWATLLTAHRDGTLAITNPNGNGITINASYNYYDSYQHNWRSLGGSTTYGTLDSSGLNLQVGAYQANGAAGVTKTCTTAITGITVTMGIITSLTCP